MSQPNMLVILSDEHQARAMGAVGHPFVRTPVLDGLAARGTIFTNAYTPCPICVPARAAFAAGRHVHEIRLWDNAMPYVGVPAGWGHALQDAGVAVESIGKLHYRDAEDPAGFDVQHLPMHVVDGVGMVWGSIRRERDRLSSGEHRLLGDEIGSGTSSYTDYDAAVTERTVAWLTDRAASADDRPWCLFVGLVAPHYPLVVPDEFYDLYPTDRLPEVKLHPRTGYRRHPWVEKQNEPYDMENRFRDPAERLSAIAAYYGLVTWLDHNIGLILGALERAGLAETTTVAYTSDHGDNLGARGLWDKSTFYEESVAIPMILAGPTIPRRTCATPVSLIDLSATIAGHFGAPLETSAGVRSLAEIAAEPDDPERVVFSEYHASGSVSAGYMLRRGRWKYHHYVGFPPALFDLQTDPEELVDLGASPAHAEVRAEMETALRAICDPEATNALAFADQDALIERHGGLEKASRLGAPGATPPPKVGGHGAS